nr:hypothetical protein [Tanacetum cinerariifolium]
MQPTFRGRLKKACNKISYLEMSTREVVLKTPYLICDYCEGSHEADECKQTNPTEKGTSNVKKKERTDPNRLLEKQKKDDKDERLLLIFKLLHINLPFLEAMIHMPKGAKVLKDLLLHKKKLKKATSSVKLKFDIEIRNKKGAKNLAADHISRLEKPDLGKLTKAEIRDLFLEERLMAIFDKNNEPCSGDGMMSSRWSAVTLSKDLCNLFFGDTSSYDPVSALLE